MLHTVELHFIWEKYGSAIVGACTTTRRDFCTYKRNKFTTKKIVMFMWCSNDMFHYMVYVGAEFVALVSLKVSSGRVVFDMYRISTVILFLGTAQKKHKKNCENEGRQHSSLPLSLLLLLLLSSGASAPL